MLLHNVEPDKINGKKVKDSPDRLRKPHKSHADRGLRHLQDENKQRHLFILFAVQNHELPADQAHLTIPAIRGDLPLEASIQRAQVYRQARWLHLDGWSRRIRC